MKCPWCDEGKSVRIHAAYVTKEGIALGDTFGCTNPKCTFFTAARKEAGR